MITTRLHNIPRPADLKDYVLKNTYKHFLIEMSQGKGHYCTKYRKKVNPEIDSYGGEEVKHNDRIIANCNESRCNENYCDTKYKLERYRRANEAVVGWILWFAKKGRVTYAQLDSYIIRFDLRLEPDICFNEKVQYKLSKKENRAVDRAFNSYTWEHEFHERKSIKVPPFNGMGQHRIHEFLIYEKDGEIALGTDLKYTNIEDRKDEYIIQYFDQFLRYPAVDLLDKAGFEWIVNDRVRNLRGCTKIKWNKTRLQDILQMNRVELKQARVFSINDVYKYWEIKGKFPKCEPLWVRFFHAHISDETWKKLKDIDKIAKLEKVMEYIKTQADRYTLRMPITDYIDYFKDLETCKEVTKQNLFPKDFQEAHRTYADKAFILKDQERNKNFNIAAEKLGENLNFEKDGLVIMLAKSVGELVNESSKLNHCVKNYAEDVANGKKAIFFIRKKEEIDEPYFTLELSPSGQIVQCRGWRNCGYGEDIENFLKEWEKVVKKEMKRRKKEETNELRKCG